MIDVEHFRARVMQDALTEATSGYWQRRADDFDAARHDRYVWGSTVRLHRASCPPTCTKCPVLHHRGDPKTDYRGQVTPEQRAARDEQLAAVAFACRARAALSPMQVEIEAEVYTALQEVA